MDSVKETFIALSPIPFVAIPLTNFFDADLNYTMGITVVFSLILISKGLWFHRLKKPNNQYDVYPRPLDSFALGAITTQADEHDRLSSSDLQKLASKIYKDAKK